MGAKITQYSLKMLTLRRKIKSFMKIGIITAMSSEQKQLANQLDNKTEHREGPFSYIEGTVKNNTHILMQCSRRNGRTHPQFPTRLHYQHRSGGRH